MDVGDSTDILYFLDQTTLLNEKLSLSVQFELTHQNDFDAI